VLYVFANLAEIANRKIYDLGQVVSGHTAKHLFAGLAVCWILRMLQKYRSLSRKAQESSLDIIL